MTLPSILLVVVIASTSCTNPLRAAAEHEAAALKASDSTIAPFEACIDSKSGITVRFEKSAAPGTLVLSGSMAKDVSKATWSKTTYENDTLVLTPTVSWTADPAAGGTTGSLMIEVKDTEGWPCKKIEWRPEILDHVIYVNADRGADCDTGSGSAAKPFKSLRYAMRAIKLLYPASAAEIRLSAGFHDAQTDDGAIKITSSLTLRGGYSPDDWSKRDIGKYATNLGYPASLSYYGVVVIDGASGVVLDGLTIDPAKTVSSAGIRSSTCVFIGNSSSAVIRDCRIINHFGNDLYAGRAIAQCEDSTLQVEDTTIDVLAVAADSFGISSAGKLSISGCTITIKDLYKANIHSISGIEAKSDATIDDCSISMAGYANANIYGVTISGMNDGPIGHIASCMITIGNELSSLALSQTGVFVSDMNIPDSQTEKFLIERNVISINGRAKFNYGASIAASKEANIINNVIHGGEGDYSICVMLTASTASINNNTLYIGSSMSSDADTAFGSCVFLNETSDAYINGNILFGGKRSSDAKYGYTGVYCESEDDNARGIRHNAFYGINNGLFAISSTDYCIPATGDGLSELNSRYNIYLPDASASTLGHTTMTIIRSGNLLFTSDLGLTSLSDEHPLMLTASSPQSISESSNTSFPDLDILGTKRTAPASLGAYEYD